MSLLEQVQLLVRARELLVEKGWTQGAYGRDVDGESVGIRRLAEAECFCTLGAGFAANSELGVFPAPEDLTNIPNFLGSVMGLDDCFITEWNDMPGRPKEEILKRFDAAIASMVRVLTPIKRAF